MGGGGYCIYNPGGLDKNPTPLTVLDENATAEWRIVFTVLMTDKGYIKSFQNVNHFCANDTMVNRPITKIFCGGIP